MAEARLDQIVKGSPPPNVSLPSVAAAAASAPLPDSHDSPQPSDPTSLLPSSPPQIYLNLLILEASLRTQYLTLRARRRQNTFVLIVLLFWILYFVWCQYLRPRADGRVGGSEYWLVDVVEKVALLSGVVMGLLFKLTGQFERGVRWPSKWLRTTNRGLRGMNCKVVILKGPWWKEMVSHLSFLFPISTLVETPGSNYQYIEYPNQERRPMAPPPRPRSGNVEVAEEDIAPGGDYIKILLLPKHFTPEFRENWEDYRAEYWNAENRRRADLRSRFRSKQKALAKQQSPWSWWVPGRRIFIRSPVAVRSHDEKPAAHQHAATVGRVSSQRHKRTSSVMREKEGSHSRSSSRSSVISDADIMNDPRERRWSTSTTGSTGGGERRRRKATTTNLADAERRRSGVAGRIKLTPASSARPVTPVADAPLRTRPSNLSSVSSGTMSSSEGDSPTRRRYMHSDSAVKREPSD